MVLFIFDFYSGLETILHSTFQHFIYYYLILAWRLYSRSHVSVVGVSSAWHTRRGHASWTLVTPPGREDAALDQVSPPSIDQPNFLPTPLPLSPLCLSFVLSSIYLSVSIQYFVLGPNIQVTKSYCVSLVSGYKILIQILW